MRYPLKCCIIKKEEEFIMSRHKTHHTKQFKLDAINYRKEHPDLTQVECAKNLGIDVSTLARWEAQFKNNDGDIPVISIIIPLDSASLHLVQLLRTSLRCVLMSVVAKYCNNK